MKKEEFTALGISEELAAKAEGASLKELESYVPKTDLEAANAEKNQLKKDIAARDKQLEDLKAASGDSDELKKQIEKLQDENKTAKKQHDEEMKELRLTTAIKLAVAGKVHDEDIVAGLFDRSKLALADDGSVAGLEGQLEAIRKGKAFLFKDGEAGQGTGKGSGTGGGYKPKGGENHTEGYAAQYAKQRNEADKSTTNGGLWGTE